jgi:DNA invertase Pin-like site-specific DNA recombinase
VPKVYSYIRFSSPEQATGQSRSRQLEAVVRYAEENGLDVDDSLKADEGISAYDGSNIASGHFGSFLNAARRGEIERGSVLLVESLDRISRQDLLSAFEIFSSIIRFGIKIVTLADRKEYDEESLKQNPFDLFASLLILQRAHEESKIKSHRMAAAWDGKRKNIAEKKLSSICPEWLRLTSDKKGFEVDPERAEIVARIFQDSQAGLGQATIARSLNLEKIAPWGRGKKKGKHWHTSTVNKILRNKAVIGHFQPHSQRKGLPRCPSGPPITDYFPQVIDESLFFEVQELRRRRQPAAVASSGTRKGKLSNLFSGLAFCGFCGEPMIFQSKGSSPVKSGKYLACSSAISGKGCKYVSVRYEAFEEQFLSSIRNRDILELLGKSINPDESAQLQSKLTETEGKINDIDKSLSRLMDALEASNGPSPSTVVSRMNQLESEKSNLIKEIESLRGKLSNQSRRSISKPRIKDYISELIIAPNLSEKEVLKSRKRLQDLIRSYFSRIVIFPRNREIHLSQMNILETLCHPELGKDRDTDSPAQADALPILLILSAADSKWPKRAIDRPIIFAVDIVGFGRRFIISIDGVISFLPPTIAPLAEKVFGDPSLVKTSVPEYEGPLNSRE